MLEAITTVSSIDKIIPILNEYGVARVENYINDSALHDLQDEYESVLNNGKYEKFSREYSIGQLRALEKGSEEYNSLSVIKEVFNSPFMYELSSEYLNEKFLLNHEIFFCKDIEGSKHGSQVLHYDRLPTLKFFIYLNDVNKNNGAFHCVPCSHVVTRGKEKSNRMKGVMPTVAQTRAHTEENLANELSVDGMAGTLIIMHTDTVHRAHPISSGERMLVRGHTRIESDLNNARKSRKKKKGLFRAISKTMKKISM